MTETTLDSISKILNSEPIDEHFWKGNCIENCQSAAVLMLFYYEHEQLNLLLTKRSRDLRFHSGEVSFPGGKYDILDKNIGDTAIRETQEEIGLDGNAIHILGHLNAEKSSSQYMVTPFVGVLPHQFELTQLRLNPNEVELAFSVPFGFFMDNSNRKIQRYKINGKQSKYYVFQYESYTIWGLTAKIIVQLIDRFKV